MRGRILPLAEPITQVAHCGCIGVAGGVLLPDGGTTVKFPVVGPVEEVALPDGAVALSDGIVIVALPLDADDVALPADASTLNVAVALCPWLLVTCISWLPFVVF